MAIEAASKSADDIPVGAVVLNSQGEVLASACNNRRLSNDPSGHAEILALRKAGELLGNWRLDETYIFVTTEPCVMCAGAIREAQVSKVAFGAYREAGSGGSLYDILRDTRLGPVPQVISGVLADECAELTKEFFRGLRGK